MRPRHAVHVLGLCNLVAGALVAGAPHLVMPGADGLGSLGARLLGTSLGVTLAAIAAGAWLMPPTAVSRYLWLFGVWVKVAGALLWGAAAVSAGSTLLASGAAADLVVAGLIAIGLRSGNTRDPTRSGTS